MVFAGWIGRFLLEDVRLVVCGDEQPGGPVGLSLTRGDSVDLPLGLVNRGHRAAPWVQVTAFFPPDFRLKLLPTPQEKPSDQHSLSILDCRAAGTPYGWRVSGYMSEALLPGCSLTLTDSVRLTVEPAGSSLEGEIIWQVSTPRRFRTGRFRLSLLDRRLKLVR